MLLHFGAGYRSNYFFVPTVNEEGQVPNYNASTALGLNGAIINKFFPPFSGLCTAGTVSSCSGQGGMMNFGSASYANNISQVPSFNTSVTWVKGNHTVKFGGEFRTEGYPARVEANTSGSYIFSPNQTGPYATGAPVSLTNPPGFGYASFLLGLVNQVSIANPVYPRLGKKVFGAYVQDSWKITRKFTLDYGLRYDYSTYLKDGYGREPFFSPTTPNPALGGILGAVEFDGDGTRPLQLQPGQKLSLGIRAAPGGRLSVPTKDRVARRLRHHLRADGEQQQRRFGPGWIVQQRSRSQHRRGCDDAFARHPSRL